MVNQVELHPMLRQQKLVDRCFGMVSRVSRGQAATTIDNSVWTGWDSVGIHLADSRLLTMMLGNR